MSTSVAAVAGGDTGIRYRGWRIVAMCAVVLGLTAPGQTVGVSVFIDPMMAGLDLSRSQVSAAYLVGTLSGAASMPWFGRLLDRRGSRWALTLVGAAFWATLTAMAGVAGLVTLTLGFVGIRMLGQGAMSMYAVTSVAYWFDRYRGRAVGVAGAGGQALMTLAPLSLAAAIGWLGWRGAWVAAGLVVGVTVLLIARLGMADSPASVGLQVDGGAAVDDEPAATARGATRGEAVRSPMFWALTGGVVSTGLIGTALAFHQISILGQQGLTPLEAAANFIPQTIAALTVTLATGALVDRVRPRAVLASSMGLLVAAVLWLPQVGPGWTAVVYGVALGAAGGSARALEGAALPDVFGTAHLGSIRGVVTAVTVVGTAVAPIILSLGNDLTGSYLPALRWLLLLPVSVVVLAIVADRVPVATDSRPSGSDG